jgi:hypothetical protein
MGVVGGTCNDKRREVGMEEGGRGGGQGGGLREGSQSTFLCSALAGCAKPSGQEGRQQGERCSIVTEHLASVLIRKRTNRMNIR